MNYPVRDKSSPAIRAIEICWQKCLPKNRPGRKKYLQAYEILDLLRELENFFRISSLLKPEEETLLRRTISQKPSLRLFKNDSEGLLLNLVHFASLEEFFETRHHIARERISRLVEEYESGYGGINVGKNSRSYGASSWTNSNVNSENYYDSYRPKDQTFTGDMDSNRPCVDPLKNIETRSHWPSRLAQEAESIKYNSLRDTDHSKWERKPSHINRPASFVSRLFSFAQNLFSGESLDNRSYADNSYGSIYDKSYANSLRDMYSYQEAISESKHYGSDPNERRLRDIENSLADVRFHAQKLEQDSDNASNKSVSKSLDELQAAVREQARVISRLEKDRARMFKTRGPKLISMLFVPWDHAIAYVTVFVKDLFEELVPIEKRTPSEFFLRLVSLFLGYFVVIYLLKVMRFLIVFVILSPVSPLSYILGYNRDSGISVPISWLQFFPNLQYWFDQIPDWVGSRASF